MSDRPTDIDRRLAAFWFADIVGFTKLSATNEPAALGAVDALRTAAHAQAERAGGRVVKMSGDAVLAEFPSSDGALRSAIALRDALGERVPLHIGVHLGEVSAQHGDIYGDGVNIAARLQTHAAPGEILASEDIYRHVRANPAFRFRSVGPLSLKGLADPMPAYLVETAAMVLATGDPAAVLGEGPELPLRQPPADGPPTNRLIVTPFRLLRPDEETTFLAFSLADAVSFSLSNLEAIVVRSSHIAGASAAGAVVDPREVARQSDVDLVVTGTLLRLGDRLQVTAELSDGRDGTRLASFRTHASLRDLFELQEELTQRIVDALALPLTTRERQLMRRDVPASARAYELYLRGNELSYRMGNWHAGRDLYRAALAEDPRYAPAWAQLGRCYRLIAKYGGGEVRTQNFNEAEAALKRALDLNPDLDLAHSFSALLETELGRCGAAMVRLLGRLEARPRGVDLLGGLVHVLRYCGLLDESVRRDQAARAIDPAARTSIAYTLFLRGDFQAAAAAGTESDAFLRALADLVLGRVEAARAFFLSAGEEYPQYERFLAPHRLALEGDTDGAIKAGTAIYEDFPDPEGRYFFARLLAWVDRPDTALDVLENVAREYAALPSPGLDPWLASVDGSERYRRLREQVETRRDEFRARYEASTSAPAT